jgi:hypothetical protein
MTACERRFNLDRLASVAAMQEQAQISHRGGVSFVPTFGGTAKENRSNVPTIRVFNPPGALTGFNRLARCGIIPLLGDCAPDVCDEAM